MKVRTAAPLAAGAALALASVLGTPALAQQSGQPGVTSGPAAHGSSDPAAQAAGNTTGPATKGIAAKPGTEGGPAQPREGAQAPDPKGLGAPPGGLSGQSGKAPP